MIKLFKILILNILFIIIINNNNNIVLSQNNNIIYNIYVSPNYGYDSVNCGLGNQTEPCQSIYQAFQTINDNSLNKNPINLILYRGSYSNVKSSQDISGYNITVTVDQTQSQYNYLDLAIWNNLETMFIISSEISTYVSISGLTLYSGSNANIPAVLVYVNIPYGQGFTGVNYGNLYSMTININNIDCNSYQSAPLVLVYSSQIVQQPSNDWNGNTYQDIDFNYTSSGIELVPNLFNGNPPIQINLYNCSFQSPYTLIIGKPIIYSRDVPTSVSLQNCIFNSISSNCPLLRLVRGRVQIDNVNITNTNTNQPLFDLTNVEVYFKDSSVQGSIDQSSLFKCSGCFLNLVYSNFEIGYTRGGYYQDYPIFDFRKSSVTMLDNQILFFGDNQQTTDQGIVSTIDSNINLRSNSFQTNVSKLLYSDGSNILFFWNSIDIQLFTGYSYYIMCSTDHQTTFFGDNNGQSSFDYFSTGCATYQNKQEVIWSFLFIFAGIGIGVIILGIGYTFKRLFENSNKSKVNNNNNNNNNIKYNSFSSLDSNIQQKQKEEKESTEKTGLLNNNHYNSSNNNNSDDKEDTIDAIIT